MNRMKTILMVGAAVVLAPLGTASPLRADDVKTETKQNADGTTTKQAPATSSADNFFSDRLYWGKSVKAWTSAALLDHKDADFCLPASMTMIGTAKDYTTVTTSSEQTATKKSVTSSDNYVSLVPDEAPFMWGWFGGDSRTVANGKITGTKNDKGEVSGKFDGICKGAGFDDTYSQTVPYGTELYVSAADAKNAVRLGWEYGVLAIPFKIQLTGKNSLSGEASVGGYFGYRLPLFDTGLVFTPVLFAGASSISAPDTSGKKPTTKTFTGVSYGFGLVTRIKDGFQAGIIVGQDHVDSSSKYAYNDKPWISFEIGYSFAQ